jgi:hypothetical protein
LGSHQSIDQVEILWPDGQKETLKGVAADRYYLVREAQGIVSTMLPQHSAQLP